MEVEGNSDKPEVQRVLSRFTSDDGQVLPGGLLDLPIDITVDKLQLIVNALMQTEDPIPLAFYIDNEEVTETLGQSLKENFAVSESTVDIVYQPQALFKVRAVTRCTGSMEGTLISFFSI